MLRINLIFTKCCSGDITIGLGRYIGEEKYLDGDLLGENSERTYHYVF